MLSLPANVNGRPNSDVVRPVISAIDIVRRPRNVWTIDFGFMSEEKSSFYEAPFRYVEEVVKPVRLQNRRQSYRERWWQYGEARPGLRKALAGLNRHIASPRVAKHRVFSWFAPEFLCNDGTVVFARLLLRGAAQPGT